MSRKQKLIARFESRPRDFTWKELTRLLIGFGYEETDAGKTGGSRRRFIHPDHPAISLHKPHPGNVVKVYVMDEVRTLLEDEGLI